MSNILIIGCCGFVGKHLTAELSKKHKVYGFDLQLFDDLKNPTCLIDYFSRINIDIIINLAAHCIIRESIANPHITFLNNVMGIHHLMETCRNTGTLRIIFTSSERVYDSKRCKLPIKEDSPLSSLNPYVASKIYSEELIKAYQNCYGINYTIFRLSTVFGENDTTTRMLPNFIRSAINNRELKIFQKKKKTVDMTYVKDVVKAIKLAVDNKKDRFTNEIFNVSSGNEFQIEELADYIIKKVGKGKKRIVEEEYKTQPTRVLLDNSKLKSRGWNPCTRTELLKKIDKTIKWWKNTYY